MKLVMQRGFSLLEILVATAILAISLISVMTIQGNSLVVNRRAELLTVATMLAQQKMTEIELELQKGLRTGEFPDEKEEEAQFEAPHDDYRWKYAIKRVELPTPPGAEKKEGKPGSGGLQELIAKQLTEELSKAVRELKLTVTWKEGEGEESVEVVTHVVKL